MTTNVKKQQRTKMQLMFLKLKVDINLLVTTSLFLWWPMFPKRTSAQCFTSIFQYSLNLFSRCISKRIGVFGQLTKPINSSIFQLYATLKVVQYQSIILCVECVQPSIDSIVYNKRLQPPHCHGPILVKFNSISALANCLCLQNDGLGLSLINFKHTWQEGGNAARKVRLGAKPVVSILLKLGQKQNNFLYRCGKFL